jgi:L-lactate permease
MLPLLALLPIIMVIIGLINLALPGVTRLILNATNMP